MNKVTILDLFPDKIKVSEEPARFIPNTLCWIWVGTKVGSYPNNILYQGQRWLGNRLSLHLKTGINPKRKKKWFACHTCDDTRCVNPEHLFIGNAKLNNLDKIKWKVQLSVEDLNSIKNSNFPSFVLAKKWHLSIAQIEFIRPSRMYRDRFKGMKISSNNFNIL